MYGNLPRREPRIKTQGTPFGKRSGFFKVVKTINGDGRVKNEIVEHFDPELGLILKKNEDGNVLVDRYPETEALLNAKKRCP